MADDRKPLSPGDPWRPSADFVNDSRDAVDYVKAQRSGGGALPKLFSSTMPWTVVKVQNKSGQDASWGDVLGLDDPLIAPTDNEAEFRRRPMFKVVTPTVDDHVGKWVVLLKPIPKDGVGDAVVSGVVSVRLYVSSPDDPYCDVMEKKTVEGEVCYLGTGGSGARILWMEEDAEKGSVVWAVVRLGGGGTSLVPFELKTSLGWNTDWQITPTHATAWPCTIQGNEFNASFVSDATKTITVVNQWGKRFISFGADDMQTDHGAWGFAQPFGNGLYGIVAIQKIAEKITGVVPYQAAVSRGTPYFNLQSVRVMGNEGQLPLPLMNHDINGLLQVRNPDSTTNGGYCLDSNARVVCEFDYTWTAGVPRPGAYVVIDGPCGTSCTYY